MTGPGPPIIAPGSHSHVQFLISNREVNAGGKEARGEGRAPGATLRTRDTARAGCREKRSAQCQPIGAPWLAGPKDGVRELQASWPQLLASSPGGFLLLQHGGG